MTRQHYRVQDGRLRECGADDRFALFVGCEPGDDALGLPVFELDGVDGSSRRVVCLGQLYARVRP